MSQTRPDMPHGNPSAGGPSRAGHSGRPGGASRTGEANPVGGAGRPPLSGRWLAVLTRHKWYSVLGATVVAALLTGGIATLLAHRSASGAHDLAENCGLVKCHANLPARAASGLATHGAASSSPPGRGGTRRSPSASPSPSSSHHTSHGSSFSTSSSPPPDVTVVYSLDSHGHGSGQFEGVLTIANHGTRPVSRWTLSLSFPGDSIAWVGYHGPGGHPFDTWRVSQGFVILSAVTSSETIAAGGSQTVLIGAQGGTTTPTACYFDGTACRT